MSQVFLILKSLARKYPFLRPLVSRIDDWMNGVDRNIPASKKQRIRRGFYSRARFKIGLVLAGLAVCFGIAYWFGTGDSDTPKTAQPDVEIGSFEDVVYRSNKRKLLELYRRTNENPMSTVPQRVIQLEKRKKIAGQMALVSEGDERDEWIANYIDNSIQKEVLYFIKDVENPNAKTELESIETRFGDRASTLVAERVGLANLVNAYFDADKLGASSDTEFLQQYQKATEVYSSNIPDIKLLYDIAQHSLDSKRNPKMLECFATSFDSNPAASGLAKLAASAALNSELAGGDISSSADVLALFEELESAIENATTKVKFEQLIIQAEGFARIGEPKKGMQLLGKLKSKIAGSQGLTTEASEFLKTRMEVSDQRFGLFDQRMSFEGVSTIQGGTAQLRS